MDQLPAYNFNFCPCTLIIIPFNISNIPYSRFYGPGTRAYDILSGSTKPPKEADMLYEVMSLNHLQLLLTLKVCSILLQVRLPKINLLSL